MCGHTRAVLILLTVFSVVVPSVQIWAYMRFKDVSLCAENVRWFLLGCGVSGIIFLASCLLAIKVIMVKKNDKITSSIEVTSDNKVKVKYSSRNNTILAIMALSLVAWVIFYIMGIYNIFVPYSQIQYNNPQIEHYCYKQLFDIAFGTLIVNCLFALPFIVSFLYSFCMMWSPDNSCC